MSKSQSLRVLVKQRLNAAAEEIFVLFERTLEEFQQELWRSREENHRQRHLLDATFNPKVRLKAADVEQVLVGKPEIYLQPQKWDSDSDPAHIKKEQEELWTSQESVECEELKRADVTGFPVLPVHVGIEIYEEKPQSLLLHERQTEENQEAESHTSTDQSKQMKTESDEDCVGPEGDSSPDPDNHLQLASGSCEPESNSSGNYCKDPGAFQLDFNPVNLCHRANTGEKPFRCSECGKHFRRKDAMKSHMTIHTGEKPFSCIECDKQFRRKHHLKVHLRSHIKQKMSGSTVCGQRFGLKFDFSHIKDTKPYRCLVCKKVFPWRGKLLAHMRSHTGEKPFSCPVCVKSFRSNASLKVHLRSHTGEKPFSCSICGSTFTQKDSLTRHARQHTGEKPFSCSVCNKGFSRRENVVVHMRIHTGEKPFSCPFCAKGFRNKGGLRKHVILHTRVQQFSCSICSKTFHLKGLLESHMRLHTGENCFSCSICSKRFIWASRLKNHRCVGESSSSKGLQQ